MHCPAAVNTRPPAEMVGSSLLYQTAGNRQTPARRATRCRRKPAHAGPGCSRARSSFVRRHFRRFDRVLRAIDRHKSVRLALDAPGWPAVRAGVAGGRGPATARSVAVCFEVDEDFDSLCLVQGVEFHAFEKLRFFRKGTSCCKGDKLFGDATASGELTLWLTTHARTTRATRLPCARRLRGAFLVLRCVCPRSRME